MRAIDRKHVSFAAAVVAWALLLGVMVSASAARWYALDALWLLLTVVFLGYGIFRRDRRSSCGRELLSLTVALVLIFPIISAADDLLLFSVPDGAQAAVSDVAKPRQASTVAHLDSPVAAVTSQPVAHFSSWYLELESSPTRLITAIAHATGNHSPPLC